MLEFMASVISPVMNFQRLSITDKNVAFPGPGDTLPAFNKPGNIPQAHFPESFLLAACRVKPPTGKLSSDSGLTC